MLCLKDDAYVWFNLWHIPNIRLLVDLKQEINILNVVFFIAAESAPSLWVGTNGGHVYIYTMTVPTEQRNESDVIAVIAREIKLRHKAPVIHIAVVDGKSRVLPEPLEVQNERAKAADYSGPHHAVVICSEEQLKVSRSHQQCNGQRA